MGKAWDKIRNVSGLAKMGGRLFGADEEDKAAMNPVAQHWGGSEFRANLERGYLRGEETAGKQQVEAGNKAADDAAARAGQGLDASGQDAGNMMGLNWKRSKNAQTSMDNSMGQYQGVRGGVLSEADKISQDADTMGDDYRRTADLQFKANQDANARNAMSIGAGRGAAGLRTALASSTAANAQAASNAEVTRANEENQINQSRINARQAAAGIRSGVGTQDQNAASMYSGRQAQFDQNAIGLNAQRAGMTVDSANLAQNAAAQRAQTGLAQQTNYSAARNDMESAQLAANQKNEDQRQVAARNNYNDKWFIMSRFNQK